jgi:hypothetical protein
MGNSWFRYQLLPFITMSEQPPKNTKTDLAIALAHGINAKSWARANAVPQNTAYRWAREPEVRKEVANCRRRLVGLAVGRLARNASRAADTIVRISREGDSDAVRLRAARAVFSDLVQVAKFSDLEGRMLDVETKLEPPAGAASGSSAG